MKGIFRKIWTMIAKSVVFLSMVLGYFLLFWLIANTMIMAVEIISMVALLLAGVIGSPLLALSVMAGLVLLGLVSFHTVSEA